MSLESDVLGFVTGSLNGLKDFAVESSTILASTLGLEEYSGVLMIAVFAVAVILTWYSLKRKANTLLIVAAGLIVVLGAVYYFTGYNPVERVGERFENASLDIDLSQFQNNTVSTTLTNTTTTQVSTTTSSTVEPVLVNYVVGNPSSDPGGQSPVEGNDSLVVTSYILP